MVKGRRRQTNCYINLLRFTSWRLFINQDAITIAVHILEHRHNAAVKLDFVNHAVAIKFELFCHKLAALFQRIDEKLSPAA